jgi:hypothetical protein
MRPCKGTYYENKEWHEFEYGLFHQWVVGYIELEAGLANYACALVEMENGKIKEVLPNNLQFIDKPYQGDEYCDK